MTVAFERPYKALTLNPNPNLNPFLSNLGFRFRVKFLSNEFSTKCRRPTGAAKFVAALAYSAYMASQIESPL